jgi:threonine dehydrogenase-like Zn-dependent dehydrogenase
VHFKRQAISVERLKDKIALITGGAGSIGAATARLFAAEGARVVVSDLDEEALQALVAELGDDVAASAVADVTDSAQVRAAVATAVERFGGLDSRSPTPASSATSRGSSTTPTTSSSACWRSTCAARSTWPSTPLPSCARTAA